ERHFLLIGSSQRLFGSDWVGSRLRPKSHIVAQGGQNSGQTADATRVSWRDGGDRGRLGYGGMVGPGLESTPTPVNAQGSAETSSPLEAEHRLHPRQQRRLRRPQLLRRRRTTSDGGLIAGELGGSRWGRRRLELSGERHAGVTIFGRVAQEALIY